MVTPLFSFASRLLGLGAVRRLFWDVETRSLADLKAVGAWRYAADPTTEILCLAYAVDDATPTIWTPGQTVPPEFVAAANDRHWCVIAHNCQFERALAMRILEPRYRWPHIPLAQQRCSMSLALANALPAALENAAEALGLPHRKDTEGFSLMTRMARPRRPRKGEDPSACHWVDGAEERERLHRYCAEDVEIERALFDRLPPLSSSEQELWVLDAIVNERGFCVDLELAKAAGAIARKERVAIDSEIFRLTEGEITSIDQVARITALIQRRGHSLRSLSRRSVSALIARDPGDDVQRLLELRQEGARASVRKFDRLLAGVDDDNRLRGTLRFHGAATGRWSGNRFQPQNLKRPETKDIGAAIDAILAGDINRVRALGAPLTVAGDISRSIICAASGHRLIGGDFSAVESRVLAWIAGETWKTANYREYDATGDPTLEPYCATATRVLKRPITPDDEGGRQTGKTCDLAFGFGGGHGAWRRFDTSKTFTDAEVEKFKVDWRATHSATVRFWRELDTAIRRAVVTGQRTSVGNRLSFEMANGSLWLTLPSDRRLAYPEARMGPGKFDDTQQVNFKDNARGGWNDCRGWYGSFTENVVQAIARDLLAAAMTRLEAAGYPVVLHVHDEVVCEVPDGSGSLDEFQRLMTELPDWAGGLPLAAQVWSGQRYAKPKAPKYAPLDSGVIEPPPRIDDVRLHVTPVPVPSVPPPEPDEEKAPGETIPLGDLIGKPLVDGKISCPFHNDRTPSLHIYDDHFYCFGCGARGDHIDWLMMVEEMDRDEAVRSLETWRAPMARPLVAVDPETIRARALRLWEQAQSIAGTLAAQYLAERRRIDIAGLPANVHEVLRFHSRCPFGLGTRHPCLIALLRDVATDDPTGIHRIALAPDASKIDRRMLGRWGAVKVWPAGAHLVVGEGIETTLAAATRIPYRGAPLQPAWSAVSSGALGKLPVVPGVERLVILVDHDVNGQGQAAAARCTERWTRAGRSVIRLKPKRPGADFNDLITLEQAT